MFFVWYYMQRKLKIPIKNHSDSTDCFLVIIYQSRYKSTQKSDGGIKHFLTIDVQAVRRQDDKFVFDFYLFQSYFIHTVISHLWANFFPRPVTHSITPRAPNTHYNNNIILWCPYIAHGNYGYVTWYNSRTTVR